MKGLAYGGWANESIGHGVGDSGVCAGAEPPDGLPYARWKRNVRRAGRRQATPRSAADGSADQLILTWKVTVAVPPLAASEPTLTVIIPAFVTL